MVKILMDAAGFGGADETEALDPAFDGQVTEDEIKALFDHELGDLDDSWSDYAA